MITFDGGRSKKKLWFAKRQLQIAKDIDVPVRATKYDGFLIRVWQQDELSGGRITAPMGAVVLYSTVDGVSILVADDWKGAFTSRTYLKSLFKDTSSTSRNFIDKASEVDMVAAGFQTILYKPVVLSSPYYATSPGGIFPPSPTYHFDSMPTPGVIPVKGGEAFWVSVSGSVFVDLDDDDIHDPPQRELHESSLNYYASDGSNLGGRMTVTFETAASSYYTSRSIHYIPSTELYMVHLQYVSYELITGVGKIAGIVYKGETDSLAYGYYELSNIIQNMPSGLQTAVLDVTANARPAGNYAFSNTVDANPILVTAIDLTNQTGNPCPEDTWFTSNPTEEKWRLSLHFNQFGSSTVYSVDSSQFLSLLDSKSTDPSINPLTNWNDAVWMLYQFFPRPNHNFTVPYDSVMFHAEDGNVYVWTREYGSVALTASGMVNINMTPPSTVSGVRPTISYAGDSLYLCVSETLETPLRVSAINIGSPFVTAPVADWPFVEWLALPLPDDDLVHVRPVRVKENDIVLLGVVESSGEYYFSFLKYKDDSGEWQRMGKLPVVKPTAEPDEANWSVGLFGIGEYVNEIPKFLSPMQVMPQMPVGPYAGYAGGMP